MLSLRNHSRLLQIPPYLSALCIIIGVAWLCLLPLNEYSRNTYVSENAILPGQVHTHFGGSEHNVFRAYRQEVHALDSKSEHDRSQSLADILTSNGLKAGIQNYSYEIAGQKKTGKNVYAVLQGPRADATEAMVLIGAWRNMDNDVNYSGVALVLSLARYFKRMLSLPYLALTSHLLMLLRLVDLVQGYHHCHPVRQHFWTASLG